MITYYDKSKKWIYYLTRPFTLFETSLWQTWYESQYMKQVFGKPATDVLCIEETRHQVRQYRTRHQLFYLGRKLFVLLVFKRKLMRESIEEAMAINQQAVKILQRGPSFFATLEESVEFLAQLVFYGALLPYYSVLLSFGKKLPRGQLGERIAKLRSISYYPPFIKNIVVPLALERLNNLGVKRAEELIDFVTIKGLLRGDIGGAVESKEQSFKEGKFFVYQQIGDVETLNWIQNPQKIIIELEPKFLPKNFNQIKGQVAFPGVVKGVVKIVRDYDSAKHEFEEGKILVAVSTNPTMLPLMKKAVAIITDEGGVTSHAAIVARELGIPCIVGTKTATKVFKDGDRVEVDAERGIVRKLG